MILWFQNQVVLDQSSWSDEGRERSRACIFHPWRATYLHQGQILAGTGWGMSQVPLAPSPAGQHKEHFKSGLLLFHGGCGASSLLLGKELPSDGVGVLLGCVCVVEMSFLLHMGSRSAGRNPSPCFQSCSLWPGAVVFSRKCLWG